MLVLVFVLSFLFFFQIELTNDSGSLITVVANTILDIGFLFVLNLLGAHYLESIQAVSKKKLNQFNYVFLAGLSYFVALLYDVRIILGNAMVGGILFISLYLWYKNGESLCRAIVNKVPLRAKDRDLFFINNPPSRRSDLVPLDIVIVLVIILPAFLKFIR